MVELVAMVWRPTSPMSVLWNPTLGTPMVTPIMVVGNLMGDGNRLTHTRVEQFSHRIHGGTYRWVVLERDRI